MTVGNIETHVTHCCTQHGCKYGDEDCPVFTGTHTQEYPCEDCVDLVPSAELPTSIWVQQSICDNMWSGEKSTELQAAEKEHDFFGEAVEYVRKDSIADIIAKELKPLKWSDPNDCVFGHIFSGSYEIGNPHTVLFIKNEYGESEYFADYDTVEEAKEAAGKHYESEVLSKLNTVLDESL